MRIRFASVFMACLAVAVTAADIGPTVAIRAGQIRGRLLPGGGATFKGLPFAQPPVGTLRWQEPVPVDAWPGIRDAGVSGPPCAQNSSGWNAAEATASREDCLYVDVWTPEWPPTARKPVMVWLHGGANTGGAGGGDPLYNGTRLIGRGVVLVIVEYRLGVFGFMAHPELTRESPHHASGNYGLLDQLAGLRWVQENIAAFGGDPDNVTVFGQSAGASDLSTLMTSPLARGLFHRAIAQSGGAGRPPALAQSEAAGVALARAVGAPSTDAISYMRALPAATLLAATTTGGAQATVDGWVLPTTPADSFATGTQLPIPFIIGNNAIEFSGTRPAAEVRDQIIRRLGDAAPAALALYGLEQPGTDGRSDARYGTVADQWSTDAGLRCSGAVLGQQHVAAGHPVWKYEFDRAIPPKPTVVHSSELPYVFGNLYQDGSQGGAYTPVDRSLSDMMQAYWTNFATRGDPNGPGLPRWPTYDVQGQSFQVFGLTGTVTTEQRQRGAFCDAINSTVMRPRH